MLRMHSLVVWFKLLDVLPFDPVDVVKIVREAAAMSLELRGQCPPDIKPDNTLVTAADRRLEDFLQERLALVAPEFSFLGEETGLTGNPDAPCWVIDPIDGTTNFVRGLPLWCISVGAVHQGRAIFGVIAVPPQDEIYWAAEGAGAWWQAHASQPEPPPPLRLHVFDTDSLMQEDLIACNTTLERAVDFKGVPCRLRNLGSLAYHLVALSRNSLIASMARQHKLYDIAAGMCLCFEAGCVAHHLDGSGWTADVTALKETRPLLVAPPGAMKILLEKLTLR
jgi:myo-inositol-1(or 4)-monophosphatase